MASLKKLEIINKRKLSCIDEPEKLNKKPITSKEHLKLLKEGKSGLDLPQLDFVLGPEKQDSGAKILKYIKEKEEKEKLDKQLKEKGVKVESFIPEEYETKGIQYFNRLKRILKRVFDSIMKLEEKDFEKMYIHSVEIIDGLSKGGKVSDIFKREHIKSIGLLFICVSLLTIIIKFTS